MPLPSFGREMFLSGDEHSLRFFGKIRSSEWHRQEAKALKAIVKIIRVTSIVQAIVRTVADFLIHAAGFPLLRIRFTPEKFSFDACGKTILSACLVFKP
jgi:hypothetical protein